VRVVTSCRHQRCTAPATTRGHCESHYRRLIRMGRHGWRPASLVRPHLDALRGLGWTWDQIATAAGLSTYVPHHAGTGRGRWVRVESVAAILAVPLTPVDSRRGVDSCGIRRRVQALAWMGWPAAEVARRVGTTRSALATLMLPTRRPSVALHRRVATVYEQLCTLPGPSAVTAGRAHGLGHAPPLAWDEDTIDQPTTRPAGMRRVS
jgi:hypothetical protein